MMTKVVIFMMLYKYVAWNNYAKENLEESKLRYNTPEQFNDPFDSFPRIELTSKERAGIVKICEEDDGVSEKFISDMPDNLLLTIFNNMDKSSLNNTKYGVTCFSKKNDNILMWSHYANNHTGICLGFEIDENEQFNIQSGIREMLIPIEYSQDNKRPVFTFQPNNPSYMDAVLKKKGKDWEYEDEYRIRVQSNGEVLFPTQLHYNPSSLQKIIFGANMSLKEFIQCQKIMKYRKQNIGMFVAVLNKDLYRLNIIPLSCDRVRMIENNYEELRHPKDLFAFEVIKTFAKGKKHNSVLKLWKKALETIPMYKIMSDYISFINTPMGDILKIISGREKGGDLLLVQDKQCKEGSVFLNYMCEKMEYFNLGNKI